jgi:hypothetical protein
MIRRDFLGKLPSISALGLLNSSSMFPWPSQQSNDRLYCVKTLTKIARPVLTSLSNGTLKKMMPVEAVPGAIEGRKKVSHLEALGRTLAGLAPWLELGADNTPEGILRNEFIQLSIASIRNAVTPSSPDYLNFTEANQPLVDAAFLGHALIRAPRQLWGNLDEQTQKILIAALLSTRVIKPFQSNWLLFSAMIEAVIFKFSKADYDPAPVRYAMEQHEQWYKGDGVYGDGADFHFDYYNSFVIQPMMLDIADVFKAETMFTNEQLQKIKQRAQRYAEIEERLISPEGTFPPVGRSLAYRCGAFQLLAQLAWQHQLPPSLPPAQVRGALMAVIKRSLEMKGTFDNNGWLTIGFCGHQPSVGESYISTGSVYLCTLAFLPLGLPSSDAYWSDPALEWTSKKAYGGKEFPIDKALKE